MNRTQFFAAIASGYDGLIARTESFKGLDSSVLNKVTTAHPWSIGQQFAHLVKSDSGVFQQFFAGLNGLPTGIEDDIRTTFLGRMITGAMVKPNIPVPKVFLPDNRPYDATIVQQYLELLLKSRGAVEKVSRLDLSKLIIKSPAGGFFRYNGNDLLAISVAHGERHLSQSESILRLQEP